MWRFSLALLVALGGCSIEGTRQLGDTCLTTRECATGLLCEFNALGNSQCVRVVVFDAAAIDVVRPADTTVADNTPADTTPADTGVDVVTDVPSEAVQPPPDVPMDAPVDVAVDVPVDVPRDVGMDVGDAGADVIDAADAADAADARDGADVEDDRPDAPSDGG